MYSQRTLPGFGNAIFLPGSAHGATPCAWADGTTTDPSGPDRAHASRSRRPGNNSARPTPGTCGRSFTGSSASAALQSFLASRLQARLDGRGGTLYRLTWSTQATPSGRPICALLASARRTSGNGCTGVPLPRLAGWSTPTATDGLRGRGTRRPWDKGFPLPQQAAMVGMERRLATGEMLTGSDAETASGDLLNPALSLWLMGLPDELLSCVR